MAEQLAEIPAQLLGYLELVGIAAVRRTPTIMAALVLVLQLAAQDIMEDVRRFLEANWTEMVRFASDRKDIEYYEHILASGQLNELLVEAVCRMKDIQLIVRHLGAPVNTSRLFGTHGPLHELVELSGQWFLLQQPIVPWNETALIKVAQREQSHYEIAEEVEAVGVAGPSRVRRNSRRSRKVIGSLTQKTLKRTSRHGHQKFEVICSPVPSHVRPILTVARRAARRLTDLARRTLSGRVRFNPVAVVSDISPLSDKIPNVVRLPEDTVRQDDGDALELVAAERLEEERVAAQEDRAAEVVGGEQQQENVLPREQEPAEAMGGQEDIMEEEVIAGGEEGEEEGAAIAREEIEEEEVVDGGEEGEEEEAVIAREEVEEEEVADGGEGEEEEAVIAREEIEEEEVADGGDQGQEEEVAANVGHAPAVEVIDLEGPAYEQQDNSYVCRLPGCPTPEKRFATLKGWKIHASHTRIHQQQGFCTSCGRYVLMPPQLEDHEKKIWLNSHRHDRCERASRTILRQRRLEKERLETLWRDASHIKLPDDDQVEARRSRKRAYPNEDERRAGVCLAYIKHLKTTNPARLDEVAADFQLTIL